MLTFLAVIQSSDESETISSTPSWNQAPMPTPSTVSGACSKEPGPSRLLFGYVLTGKYPTNLQFHPTEYDDMLQRETIKKQLTLEEADAIVTHHHHSSRGYQLITHKLAIFLGSTNVAKV